ncbi:MAG TPA: O-antigen ligase family protein [Planctomycetota bacterium]|nr:O-antigen ligase family protein [Planctomycetota bacterium]
MISGDADPRTPLPKILQVMGTLGVFMTLGYLTLRGLSLEELMLPAAALGLPIYLVVLVDPILGVAILIACIGLSPEFSIGGIRNLRVEDFLLPGLLLGWLLRTANERVAFAPTRLWTPALVSFGAMIISTLAGGPGRSGSAAMPYLIMGKYAEYMVMYLIVINTVKTETEVRALAIFAVLVALTSAILSLGGSISSAANTVEGRVRGPMGETSNIFGGYLALNLMIALGLFLHSTTPGSRLAAGTGVVLLCICVLFTYSRTSYVAVGGAILLFGIVKYRRLLIILLILAAIVPVLAPGSVTERLATVGGVASGPTPGSWSARLYAWEWAMNRMSPVDRILGLGIGSVAFGDVDSEYVRIFSDMGVVGVILFAWMLFRIGSLANKTYDSLEDFTFPKGYLGGYLMAFVTMIIHSIAATTFSAIRTEETFMVLTGLMTVIANQREILLPGGADRPVVLLRDASILETERR